MEIRYVKISILLGNAIFSFVMYNPLRLVSSVDSHVVSIPLGVLHRYTQQYTQPASYCTNLLFSHCRKQKTSDWMTSSLCHERSWRQTAVSATHGHILIICHLHKQSTRNGQWMLKVYLFADDTKLFRRIQDDSDCSRLQSDLTSLQNWSKKWLLTFHPGKCKSMRIGRREGEDYM